MLFEELLSEERAEGRVEGRVEGKAEFILELLEELGPVPKELLSQIQSETDVDRLSIWHKAAARAESMDQFMKIIEEQ